MSNRAITWAYKQTGLKAGRKFILVTLADMADSEHSCFPKVELLAELTGIGPSVIRDHLIALDEDGYISRQARRRKDGTRASSRYYLDVDGALADQEPETGTGQEPVSGTGTSAGNQDYQAPETSAHISTSLNPHLVNPHPSTSSSDAAEAAPRPELETLLDLLDELIVTNGSKPPSRSKKNLDAVRLLVDRDGRTVEQVEACIRWCQADEFWRSNILSMSKLREKYDQLRLDAARRPNPGAGVRMTNARRNLSTVQRFRELENQQPRQIGASA